MKKIILWSFVLVLLTVWVYFWYNNNSSLDWVSANPDYICKKAVVGSPCEIPNYPASCSAWNSTTHSRTCPWKKTTEVSYYLIRTNCESWYTKVANYWNSGWDSWRNSADYVSSSSSCTITEYDTVAPSWKIN